MRDEFYVGYLPLPRAHKRFLLALVCLLVVGALATSVLLTSQQNDPGNGQWDLNNAVTLTGTLRSKPYTMLVIPDDEGGPTQNILLVTMGKIGGSGLALPADGRTVSVTGYPISRGRDTVLLTVENPVTEVSKRSVPHAPWSLKAMGSATLRGQIIDPKCYFGAMKPGEGKVHKACATLCLQGGIAPMLMTTDAAGERTYYLLLDQDGRGIVGDRLRALLPFVADPVRMTGEIARAGNLLIFRTDPTNIQRVYDRPL